MGGSEVQRRLLDLARDMEQSKTLAQRRVSIHTHTCGDPRRKRRIGVQISVAEARGCDAGRGAEKSAPMLCRTDLRH